MKRIVVFVFGLLLTGTVLAQDSAAVKKMKKDWSKVSLANRPKDHFLIQMGYNNWTKVPDSINNKGIHRSVNVYFMMDFPFKTDPRISVAIGAGVSSDNQYFKTTSIDIAGKLKNELTFKNVSDTTHFKKYKMQTTYLEAPIELRFTKDPENPNKSFKGALGVKIGTLVGASVKGKNWVNSKGNLINGYTQKEKSKTFINNTRMSIMGRVGYGIISIYASYQLNAFIKDGLGPDIRPMQIGITISGL